MSFNTVHQCGFIQIYPSICFGQNDENCELSHAVQEQKNLSQGERKWAVRQSAQSCIVFYLAEINITVSRSSLCEREAIIKFFLFWNTEI